MRITTLLLLVGSLHLSASSLSQTVSLQAYRKPLRDVLDEVKKQTGYSVVYNDRLVERAERITIQADHMPLNEFLNSVLTPSSLIYQLNAQTILIKIDPTSRGNNVTTEEIPPQQPVSGIVTDADGQPLAGVSVKLAGTNTGTVTDADGRYQLEVPGGKGTLVFTYIGFVPRKVSVDGSGKTVSISMQEEQSSLNEVVIVGYGTQRKIETTGSIASVSSSEINQTPVANLAQGMQARVPGVQITQNSGAPGGNISVRIRGTNSIQGTSEPLYIVDGVQISNGGGIKAVSPLSTINPGDIESIEVLKDASSTAIYGARAANGVVLITTKRGKSGPTRVVFDSYYGSQRVTKMLPVLNAQQFAELENETFKNNFYPDPASLGEGVNWQRLIFRDAPIQNHQLSISGGSEKTLFALSANYFDQDGIIIKSNFKRYAVRLNLDHTINPSIKIGANILASNNINRGIQTGGTTESVTANILGAAISAPPTMEPYREDGTLYPFGEQAQGRYREVFNPLGLAEILERNTINRTLGNFYGEATILEGLTYKASFIVDIGHDLRDYYSPLSIISIADRDDRSGSGEKTNVHNTTLLHESVVTYNTSFADQHRLKFTGLYAAQVEMMNRAFSKGFGFPNDATLNEALQLAQNFDASSDRSKAQLVSYMGRINYGYGDRFFLDVTARIDGSSKFGKNNKYGFFPAVSGAWRLIEEDFLKNSTVFSDLKLRASYGVTGNAGAIGAYQSLNTVAAGGGYVITHIFNNGIKPSGIANPDLRWERSTQSNIGMDIGLGQGRYNFTFDVYHKRTDDLLYVKALPLSSGYPNITGNFASLENKGIELAGNAILFDGDFKWDMSANLSINKNKVLSLDGGITTERFVNTYSILKEGEPLGSFKTYVFDGINQPGDEILPGYDGRVGGHKIRDMNQDGQINSADQVITGNPNPKFIFGFSTNLSYKHFDFSAFLSGVQGNDLFNFSRYRFENPFGLQNLLKVMEDRWTPTNPSNQYASALQGGRLPVSDTFIEDGSFIRCKNVTLGYTLTELGKISSLRVYLSANNLFTITGYSGYDPEVNSYAGDNRIIGVDNTVYPQARSFLAGIQLSF
ncbi:SusC/RagA family TonB-linked outer membrane protein [Parapedobacter indicus]|nr:TonB-dependent receptor [Parapedobacter indicus]